jgi:ubiquinone/menaquinone biosynthesis C-methylase UbiE
VDQDTFTSIAHRDHRYLNPIGADTMDAVLRLARLAPGAKVVDLGCGKAEALIRLVELYGVDAVGVDRNARFLAEADERARAIVPDGALRLVTSDAADFHAEPQSFELALCVGSTHLYGGLAGTLAELTRLLGPGGSVILGEGYWRRSPPSSAYLSFLGARAGDLQGHEGNQQTIRDAGFELMRSWTSSDAEWDAYEGMYLAGVERYARERPDDPEVPAMLERIRGWHDAYQRLGRHELGFGIYFARRPRA